ncbi:hypothetical protein EG329_006284 [Mollisiaceae sp. DMI_Dod_QoI]|nr:hypothetical protein EG329_006284 [Helotiales sp. DMI_Dod_QoI]
MKWICCSKHSHPSNSSIPWSTPTWLKTCNFPGGCDHERCGECTLPSIESWYSSSGQTTAMMNGGGAGAGTSHGSDAGGK